MRRLAFIKVPCANGSVAHIDTVWRVGRDFAVHPAEAFGVYDAWSVTHSPSHLTLCNGNERPYFHTRWGAAVAAYRIALTPLSWSMKVPYHPDRAGHQDAVVAIRAAMLLTAQEELLWLNHNQNWRTQGLKRQPTELVPQPSSP